MTHWAHMTSNVRHLFLTVEDWQGYSLYVRFERSGSAVGNKQSVRRSSDRADFCLAETAVAPRPMYKPLLEPVPPSNKNPLSFFSLSF